MKLWTCPKCGVEGRFAHRYASPTLPKPEDKMDPGECPTGRGLQAALAAQARRHSFLLSVLHQAGIM